MVKNKSFKRFKMFVQFNLGKNDNTRSSWRKKK